jgi:hypothetical protein
MADRYLHPPADEHDDIDRLFARLDRAPAPDDLTARVLANTVARTEAARAVLAWPWMVAGLFALGLLALAGYQLGASLAANNGLELVTALLEDAGLLTTAPGDVAAALRESIPWGLVIVAGFSATLLIVAAGNVVSRTPSQLQRTRSIA